MVAYGMEFGETHRLAIEIYCYMYDEREENDLDLTPEDRRDNYEENRNLGIRFNKFYHYCNIVDILWNWREGEDGANATRVIWNVWTERMLRAMVENDIVSFAGCASSGKSASASIHAIVQFICAPNESLILITSTSIKGAQLRVWKCLSQYWHALPKMAKFGEMVYSKAAIRGWDATGQKSDSVGIQIVAAGSGSEKDAYDTLVGIKQERLYLIADELPQLPKMIIEAAFGNMVNGTNKKKQEFKMVAMGNPALMTDAFGDMCEPVDGWDSVTEMDDSWETARGKVLRFDAERNPNVLLGEDLYPWYPSRKAIQDAKGRWGERSLMFYKQYKAFWYREASTETIYSESEIVMSRSNKPYNPELDGEIISRKPISGADPAFTQGGDEFPQVGCDVVTNTKGKTFLEVKWDMALEEQSSDDRPRSHKMVEQLMMNCRKHSVDPACFGYDATGTGIAFRDVVVSEWSSLCQDIQFGGNPSDRPAGSSDTRKSSDVYRNRVSELWVKAKGLIREGRIRGLTDKMCARRYNTTTRSGSGIKICIESKTDMKKREGYSPDWADCFVGSTLVTTINGDVAIKDLKAGDLVLTPSGYHKVIHMHSKESSVISNAGLTGTADHIIQTMNGESRLDSLSVDNQLLSVENNSIWLFLQKSYTRINPSTFKHQAGITRVDGKLTLRDFYTEGYGLMSMERFLKASTYTTKTGIGRTVISTTLRLLNLANTDRTTQKLSGKTVNTGRGKLSTSQTSSRNQECGISQKKVKSTTKRTEEEQLNHAGINLMSLLFVNAAVIALWLLIYLQGIKSIVAKLAGRKQLKNGEQPNEKSSNALCADQRRKCSSTHPRQPAQEAAQTEIVYCPTLEKENVFYANGVLVNNCFFIALETAIINGLMFDVEVANINRRSSPSWGKAMKSHDVLAGSNLYH